MLLCSVAFLKLSACEGSTSLRWAELQCFYNSTSSLTCRDQSGRLKSCTDGTEWRGIDELNLNLKNKTPIRDELKNITSHIYISNKKKIFIVFSSPFYQFVDCKKIIKINRYLIINMFCCNSWRFSNYWLYHALEDGKNTHLIRTRTKPVRYGLGNETGPILSILL